MEEVTISELTKNFDEIVAVDNMNLSIPQGSVFGLLGPNGAGKSTTIRLLCTLLRPTGGTAVVAGHDIIKEPVEVRKATGVLPEEGNHTLYPTLTAYENLLYFARLYDVPEEEIGPRIAELLEFMELWDRKDDKSGELSTGNRQRLALCRALLHKPSVLLLDEPTSALDPIAAKRVRELIMSFSRKYGQTFFVNSHNLAEVQRMCDRIAIIDKGKVLLTGDTSELRSKLHAKQEFRIRTASDIDSAEKIVRSANYVETVEKEVDTLLVKINDPLENNSKLMKSLIDAGVKIVEFAEEETTLEDLYLQTITGGGKQ